MTSRGRTAARWSKRPSALAAFSQPATAWYAALGSAESPRYLSTTSHASSILSIFESVIRDTDRQQPDVPEWEWSWAVFIVWRGMRSLTQSTSESVCRTSRHGMVQRCGSDLRGQCIVKPGREPNLLPFKVMQSATDEFRVNEAPCCRDFLRRHHSVHSCHARCRDFDPRCPVGVPRQRRNVDLVRHIQQCARVFREMKTAPNVQERPPEAGSARSISLSREQAQLSKELDRDPALR